MAENPLSILLVLASFIGSYILMILTAIVGMTGHFFYWILLDICGFGPQQLQKTRKLINTKNNQDVDYYALILGSGFSGLGMAIKLKQLGTDNFVVIERHGHVGGTWYANKYPGCACDVPSNLYSYSFEPNPNWSYFFGRQDEIREYLDHCTDKYDIRRHVKLNTTLTRLEWLDDKRVWRITLESKGEVKQVHARFVMLGYGPLSNASMPDDVAGIDRFQGQMCHTAEWDSTINFENKRVAVIGTGASAIQTVPELQKINGTQLVVFQRTPPWIIPRADRVVTKFEKKLFAYFPLLQKFIRAIVYWFRESTVFSFTFRLPVRFLVDKLVMFNIRRQVPDPELRKKLIPKYDLGCKRVLLTNDWYPALQKPNVKLVTERIQEVKANSIVTRDGTEHPVDIIVWSTGFQVQTFSLPIYGRNGLSLQKQWAETIQAYRGVTTPNFPNLFLLLGPNTGLGHNSIIVMIEAQINYIAEILLYMDEKKLSMVDVKSKVHDEFNRDIQSRLKGTVWQSGGCHSWYQDAKGNNTTIWPGFTWTYMLLMKKLDVISYNFD